MDEPRFIQPEWPAPENVRAVTSTRIGGASRPPFDTFNLGARAGDDALSVKENRRRLREALSLPEEPRWLAQVHGIRVVSAATVQRDESRADAAVSDRPGVVCAVLTADCLPVLLCDRNGRRIGIAHAGWRGLSAGIIEQTVKAMGLEPGELLAWLGPAIGPDVYEVGADVLDACRIADPGCERCFRPGRAERWYADIYALARRRLEAAGVHAVYGGGLCTYTDAERFYSYRRDSRTGRMATLIWRTR